MLEDIDPTLEWVEKTHPTEFDPNIDDLGLIHLDLDPGVAPVMAGTSSCQGSCFQQWR